jgi:hypothetical protein
MLYEIILLLAAWSRICWGTFKRMVCDLSGLWIAAAIEDNQDALTPISPPSPFFRLPRELRDTIYNLFTEDQVSNHSRRMTTTRFCRGPCLTETFPGTTPKKLHELQQALIKKNFALTFDCTCLLSFLQNPVSSDLRKELKRLRFHWRGEIYGYPTETQDALGKLQTLPALTHLVVRITNSLPLPERARFLEERGFANAPRDFCWTVADAIGFDELCSVRGLPEVQLEVDYLISGSRPPESEIQGLKEYLEANLKREKPPVCCLPLRIAHQRLMIRRDMIRCRRCEHNIYQITEVPNLNGLEIGRRTTSGHLLTSLYWAFEYIHVISHTS